MGPLSQRFKRWPSPFRRGSSPCSASAPSSWGLRWIRPERTAACFPEAEGPLPGGPPRAYGRSLSGRRRCRLRQLVGFNPKDLLGAVASVRGLGRRCRQSPGCRRHRWTSPNTSRPWWRGAPVLHRCGRRGPFCPPGYVRRSEDRLCEPQLQPSGPPVLLDDAIEAILTTARSPRDRDSRGMVDIALWCCGPAVCAALSAGTPFLIRWGPA